MKVTFLGGADEIGASGTLVEIGGKRLLVDCGVRHHKRDGETLPWLAAVQDAGGVDAIVLTHAHMDHSGALPVASRSFKAPIFMTAPTRDIVSVLLTDATKIMEQEYEREGEMPLYNSALVEATIAATRKVSFLDPVRICEGVSATFHPAGHILGAASVVFESAEGSLMISGDIFATDQLTVPGLMVPPLRPDGMILECTYGNRLHVNRSMEEKRLIEQLNTVIQRGGTSLIPAFAVGRSQEVLLILLRAIEQGKLPRVPIFIDGMVRSVCNIYAPYKDWCTRWLRKRIKDLGNPFTYPGSPAVVVRSAREREQAAETAPAIIVASSGMLSGGPSQFYAGKLAEDPKNLIALCGYNDEESPGRKLLEVAEAGTGELKLGERTITPKCTIGMYHLSAHSDASELAAEARAMNPKQLFLVHGEDGARESLADDLKKELKSKIFLPELGTESWIIRTNAQVAGGLAPKEIFQADSPTETDFSDEGEPLAVLLTLDDLPTLGRMLLDRDGAKKSYTVRELMRTWGYAKSQMTDDEADRIDKLINRRESPFVRDKRRMYLYAVNPPLLDLYGLSVEEQPSGPMPIAVMLKQVDQLLPPETGLYRKSYIDAEKSVRLSFYFPKIAQGEYAEAIQWLEDVTGWKFSVNPEPNFQRMKEVIGELIPADWQLIGDPSIRRETEHVTTLVAQIPDAEHKEELCDTFARQTGYTLDIVVAEGKARLVSRPVGADGAASVQSMMELNQAYQHIKHHFDQEPNQPLKVGMKSDVTGKYIEVAFLSAIVGEWYLEDLARLQEETGWEIRLKPTTDEYKIKELARQMCARWKIVRGPGLTPGETEVKVWVSDILSEEEEKELIDEFYYQTGFELYVEIKGV